QTLVNRRHLDYSGCPVTFYRANYTTIFPSYEDGMKSFLIGLGLGVGLGILFAPMSGEETRNNLSDRANDLANSARETYEQSRDRVQRGVESIRNTTERTM